MWASIFLFRAGIYSEYVLKVLDNKIASDSVRDGIIKVLKIVILCTTKLPNLHPCMNDVVKMLVDAEPYTFRSPSKHGKKEQVLV
ncbi:hypothetical protein RHSIM_Rhsim12G0051500 [Rhododendron simsii]|uniref:Uncharacterized protein n=1 Tax=Rhododendron simsii TaxID=118357 RepID=A0A834G1E4_RHOSS|nr:hypothetical protein RHSIM_Rhsim12G0051500 [Rhododendron simsii]